MSAEPAQCVRSECTRSPLDGLDLCNVHHQEIILGLDECKALDCDKRVPFGSLWCGRHAAMRADGSLSAQGEPLNVPVESAPCRICGAPSLKRTVGKRPQGGWNDLCQEHYDEKRSTHAASLSVARAAIGGGDGRKISGGLKLAPAPPPRVAPDPPPEHERRAEYLRSKAGWQMIPNHRGEEAWFLPVEFTQPVGGRTVDEAYDWQVGMEANRHGPDLADLEVTEPPEPRMHAVGCMLAADHDNECYIPGEPDGEPARWEETPVRTHEEGCALDTDHRGACRSADREEEHKPRAIPAPPVMPTMFPLVEMGSELVALEGETVTLQERLLAAWVDAIAETYSTLAAELVDGTHERARGSLEILESLLKQAPGLRLSCELLEQQV